MFKAFIQNTEHILQANKIDGIWSPSLVGADMVKPLGLVPEDPSERLAASKTNYTKTQFA